ncbi:Homeobox-leucine zipper protein [Tripterygium wilfordii]|uniref:Homeobox-leucine zipper protein n=1 Tax=Tripterygium wilfordii TaxID=458696 RepID=A0A7J7DWH7_TRIWF|nr:homeobox-leucine zipper protein HAT14-like [Tripterygium wilfordii]KAF5750653.1 Homeobox-leucine zipper protein [Tripterygium wilfordii]
MELALSLGDASKPLTFIDKNPKMSTTKDLGFCMGLGTGSPATEVPVQLDLLPFSPVPRPNPPSQLRFPWIADPHGPGRGLDVNRFPGGVTEEVEEGASLSSPNSTTSSFQMDFGIGRSKRELEAENERTGSKTSDDEENGLTRKKLRLSKEQSAFLEESFKEHNTLNPKQKLALSKQLNLRPRQVEVWFQNRRARTKLKQTEVDCEYLKRCCETLTEENRRLQKELQELRALKSSQSFYMQLPATTLTMCPSCERVATTTAAASTTTNTSASTAASTALSLSKPRPYPFPHGSIHMSQAQSQAHQAAS